MQAPDPAYASALGWSGPSSVSVSMETELSIFRSEACARRPPPLDAPHRCNRHGARASCLGEARRQRRVGPGGWRGRLDHSLPTLAGWLGPRDFGPIPRPARPRLGSAPRSGDEESQRASQLLLTCSPTAQAALGRRPRSPGPREGRDDPCWPEPWWLRRTGPTQPFVSEHPKPGGRPVSLWETSKNSLSLRRCWTVGTRPFS